LLSLCQPQIFDTNESEIREQPADPKRFQLLRCACQNPGDGQKDKANVCPIK